MILVTAATAYASVAGEPLASHKYPPAVQAIVDHPFLMGGSYLALAVASRVHNKNSSDSWVLGGFFSLLFSSASGLLLGPLLYVVNALASERVTLSTHPIRDALLLTLGSFLTLTFYALGTLEDFDEWHGFLVVGVSTLLVASLLNLFLQSSAISLALSSVGILIFAGFVLHDTSRVIRSLDNPISGAMQLYLDFLNMFTHILTLLSGEGRD